MKVTIPENISDITLEQFQKFALLENEDNNEKVKIFIGLSDEDILGVSQSDFNKLVNAIDEALAKQVEFQPRFEMNGVKFGFHPNLDRMTTAEYVDLMNYNSQPDTLHKLMAILFRPITGRHMSGNYKIASYNGTEEYSNYMKKTPLHIVNGALVFFLNLSSELRRNILKYSNREELQKARAHQIIGLNGVGTQPSSN